MQNQVREKKGPKQIILSCFPDGARGFLCDASKIEDRHRILSKITKIKNTLDEHHT